MRGRGEGRNLRPVIEAIAVVALSARLPFGCG